MKIYILLFNLILFSACGIFRDVATTPQISQNTPTNISEDITITKSYVETGGLYDRNYELIIRGTGKITFKNNCKHKETAEQEEWQISRDELLPLIEAIQNIDFFNLKSEYGTLAVDGAISTISINFDNKKKTIKRLDFNGTTSEEKDLRKLEILINKTADAETRIRKACYSHNEPPLDYPSESLG